MGLCEEGGKRRSCAGRNVRRNWLGGMGLRQNPSSAVTHNPMHAGSYVYYIKRKSLLQGRLLAGRATQEIDQGVLLALVRA